MYKIKLGKKVMKIFLSDTQNKKNTSNPNHALFVSDLKENRVIKSKFFCLLLFEEMFTSFFKGKKSKRSQGFSYKTVL